MLLRGRTLKRFAQQNQKYKARINALFKATGCAKCGKMTNAAKITLYNMIVSDKELKKALMNFINAKKLSLYFHTPKDSRNKVYDIE